MIYHVTMSLHLSACSALLNCSHWDLKTFWWTVGEGFGHTTSWRGCAPVFFNHFSLYVGVRWMLVRRRYSRLRKEKTNVARCDKLSCKILLNIYYHHLYFSCYAYTKTRNTTCYKLFWCFCRFCIPPIFHLLLPHLVKLHSSLHNIVLLKTTWIITFSWISRIWCFYNYKFS